MSDTRASESGVFTTSSANYDRFMGRYSRRLAAAFVDAAGIEAGQSALDVGCGPGAVTGELVRRLGPASVAAVEPAPQFVAACRERYPGVDVRRARAEELPYPDDRFDVALAQLVLHFVVDPDATAREMRRVVRPGGTVGACVWDFADGMRMLRLFWDAALAVDAAAPDEATHRPFGRDGEIGELFRLAGLENVTAGSLEVEAGYESFTDFWEPFLTSTGPAGSFIASLDEQQRARLRDDLRARLGSPEGPFTLPARAWYATGRV
jgi:ubiquinone/menaquinone biosynthesis C-methylase UbiE